MTNQFIKYCNNYTIKEKDGLFCIVGQKINSFNGLTEAETTVCFYDHLADAKQHIEQIKIERGLK